MVRLLTKGDVCRAISISPRTLDYWIKAGKFPQPIRVNGQRLARWRPSDLDEWIDGQPRAKCAARKVEAAA